MSQDAEPSPLDKLLALLDQAVVANELPEDLDEVLELDPEPLAAKVYELAGDSTLAVPFRVMAILAVEQLPYTGIRERDDFKQILTQVLQPVFEEASNPAAVRAAAVYMLQENYAFVDDDYEPVADDDPSARQEVLRQGALQSDVPLITAICIGQLQPETCLTILPQLISFMSSSATRISEAATECMERLGPAADAAIPAHLQLLQQPDHPHRYQLLRNLGAIRTRPELTVPFLQQIVKTPESDDFGIALSSLMQIVVHNDLDTTEYVAFLEKSLRENTGNDLQVILGAIYLLGVKARPIRPLVKLLDRHPNKSIARQARETLRAMRLPKKDAATD